MNLPLAPAEGFTPVREFEIERDEGGFFRSEKLGICWCYACGAALVIDVEDLFDPFDVHRKWHEKIEGKG